MFSSPLQYRPEALGLQVIFRLNNRKVPGMVVNAFDPSTQQRQVDFSEFEASLIYIEFQDSQCYIVERSLSQD